MRKAGPGGILVPTTIRLSAEALSAIEDIARENCISKAEVMRLALMDKLYRYLGDVRIVDEQQAGELQEKIGELFTEISKMRYELNRIGVNYNQAVKEMHVNRKMGGIEVTDGAAALPSDIDTIMDKYEKATKEMGALLCRILL